MLLQGLHWVWVALVSLGYGAVLLPVTEDQLSFRLLWQRSVAGLLLAAFLGLLVHFFLPINAYVSTGIGVVGILLGIWQKAYSGLKQVWNSWQRWGQASFLVLLVAALIKACAPSTYTDFGVYYIPTMRWIEHYALVPGLANLHTRLGFNSLWHMACVVLNPLQTHYALDGLNEYLFLGTVAFFSIDSLAQKKTILLSWQVLLGFFVLALSVVYISFFLTAPTPDLPVILFMWLLVDYLLPKTGVAAARRLSREEVIYPLFLATALVLVKVSALPALALVGLWLLVQPRWWQWWRLLSIPATMLGAWILTNWVLTGYPLFPVPMHLPPALVPTWQVPLPETELAYVEIKGFARYLLRTPDEIARYTYPILAKMPLGQWLPLWASQKSWIDWTILGLEALALGVCVLRAAARRYTLSQLMLLVGLSLGWVFWFLSAPGIRFSVCYLVPLLTLATEGIAWPKATKLGTLGAGIGLALCVVFLVTSTDMRVLRQYLVTPCPWPVVATKPSPDGPYSIAAEVIQEGLPTQCWDAALPCAEFDTHHIKRRGPSLGDGFEPVLPK